MAYRMTELLLLLQVLFVGRVALSLLPPGRVGSHRPEGLAATLAASLLVGRVVLVLGDLPHMLLGLPGLSASTLALLAVGALAVRWLTLPGAFVATPPPRVDPAGPRDVALRWLAAVAIAVGLVRAAHTYATELGTSSLPLMGSLPYLALPVLLDHALRELELPAGPRTWVWLLPALLVWLLPQETVLHAALPWIALDLGTGAAFLIVRRRRADRRALALSAIAFGAAACSAPAAWPLGLAGLAMIVLATPSGGRARVLPWALALAVLLAPIALELRARAADPRVDPTRIPPIHQPPGTLALMLALAIPLLLLALVVLLGRRATATRAS